MGPGKRNTPSIDSLEQKDLTNKQITGCHFLDHEGVTTGCGHVSVRIPEADAIITVANVNWHYSVSRRDTQKSLWY